MGEVPVGIMIETLPLLAQAFDGGGTGVDASDWWRVLSLRDYNTRLVVLSVAVLGMASGLVGSFLLLRRQSLMGDALSHATLPGIGLAFLLSVALGGNGRSMPMLLAGATCTGLLGVATVMVLTRATRLKEDAAMGVVLSVFFGAGVVLMRIVQETPNGAAAGLNSFIYGKTASVVPRDLMMISGVAVVVIATSLILLKELTLLSFDSAFAAALGRPVGWLEAIMLLLITAVTVVGLQAVGLILVLSFLITPPAAARFWTDDLRQMLLLSAVIGAISGGFGAVVSGVYADLPAGALIVLTASAIFLMSLMLGTKRGLLLLSVRRFRLRRKVQRQHLLRAIYEAMESAGQVSATKDRPRIINRQVSFSDLVERRAWTAAQLRRKLNRARRYGAVRAMAVVVVDPGQTDTKGSPRDTVVELTDRGFAEAARTTRNHRLWETYLITHADIAPNHVDRDADMVEHVLSAEMIERLEANLVRELRDVPMPESPHALELSS